MIEEQLLGVRFVAEKIHRRLPPGIALELLIRSGISGLLQAVERDNPRRSTVQQAYAKYRIQSELMAYLRSLDWVSQAVRAWGRKESGARRALAKQLGREARREEIATALNVSLAEYERIIDCNNEPQFLTRRELKASSEKGWSQVQEEFFSRPSQDPLLFLREPAMLELVQEVLGTLPEQKLLVMTLAHYEEMTPREISEVLNITEEQVSQIHSEVVAYLRQSFQAKHQTTRSGHGEISKQGNE